MIKLYFKLLTYTSVYRTLSFNFELRLKIRLCDFTFVTSHNRVFRPATERVYRLETICLAHYRLPPRTAQFRYPSPLLFPPPSIAALREPCKITSTATVSSPIIHEEFEITFFSTLPTRPLRSLDPSSRLIRADRPAIGRYPLEILEHRIVELYNFSFQSVT